MVGIAFDAAVGEANDARRVFEQALIVRGEDECKAEAAVEVAHQVNELGGIAGVEIGGWLVGKDKSGAMDDGASYGDALALTAGEQVRTMISTSGEADILQGFSHTAAAFRAIESLNEQGELDVLGSGEDRDEVEGLKDEADLFAAEDGGLGRTKPAGVNAFDENPAAGGFVDTANQVEKGRLAAATRAGYGEKLAGTDGEAQAAEGDDVAVVEGEPPGDLFDADECVRCVHRALFLSMAVSLLCQRK